MPVSSVLSNLILFGIQMLLVLALLFWYALRGAVAPTWRAWALLPTVLLQLGVMGMGLGIIISSLTTKYRDLSILVDFGMTLWMYATPVVYPLSTAGSGLRRLLELNPVTAPIELYRHILLGVGEPDFGALAWSWVFTLITALFGVVIFNRIERTFIDTV